MAKAAPAPAPALGAEGAPAPKSKKLIIVIAAVLLLVIVGGAGAFFMLKGKGEANPEEEVKAAPAGPPAFVVMDPFVVNLAEPDTARYLQIGITYETSGPSIADEMKVYTPVIRSRILLVLSGKNVEQLTSIEGKQLLMDELVDLARVTIQGDQKDPSRGIRDVHFASFVIQ